MDPLCCSLHSPYKPQPSLVCFLFFPSIEPVGPNDTTRLGYLCVQVKKPSTLSFLPLGEALVKPEPFMETDFAKIGRPGVLHQAFRGLDKVGTVMCTSKVDTRTRTWYLDNLVAVTVPRGIRYLVHHTPGWVHQAGYTRLMVVYTFDSCRMWLMLMYFDVDVF